MNKLLADEESRKQKESVVGLGLDEGPFPILNTSPFCVDQMLPRNIVNDAIGVWDFLNTFG